METEAMMKSVRGGQAVPLKQVSIVAQLADLLAIVTVTHTYRNDGKRDIEAVYTFPLPQDAVLLDLELIIGERRLCGQVVEKREAAVRYEQAIEAGHGALMLEHAGDGLYTLNLGNLKAGEEAVVTFRYGLIGRWNGDEYAFRLPTTLAPRYGDPAAAGLAPHQVPPHSLAAHYPFALRLEACGRLHGALIHSPSHAIDQTESADRTLITLAPGATLDRDLVVSFIVRGDGGAFANAFAYYAPDGDRYAAWASFRPQFSDADQSMAPRSLRLIIDCSGSMNGDSIAQARQALLDILERLIPEDRFNITAFGSQHKHLFLREVAAHEVNLAIARQWIARLEADMGGTEMSAAVETACRQEAGHDARDVLLITDGEVWDAERISEAAQRGKWRIFAVGVGSAPAEPVLRKLADTTGGAIELVVPGEDMSRRIVRHFERLRQPHAPARLTWPAPTAWLNPANTIRCFHGDTVNAFAVLTTAPAGEVALDCAQTQGEQRFAARIEAAPTALAADLPRLVAAHWLQHARPQHAAALALRYQLVSEYTNYLVVLERRAEEAGDGQPELQQVPQMLAAGWGGAGSVLADCGDIPVFLRRSHDAKPLLPVQASAASADDLPRDYDFDIPPSFMENIVSKVRKTIAAPPITAGDFLHVFAGMCKGQSHPLDPAAIRLEPLRKKAPAELCRLIDTLVAEGHDERQLWMIVALVLASLPPHSRRPDSRMMLLLKSAVAQMPEAAAVADRLAALIDSPVGDAWRGLGKDQHATLRPRASPFNLAAFLRKHTD